MQLEYKPQLCFANSYCLQGVYTPIVDPENPRAAQSCVAGTQCNEGSDSPEGKGSCSLGYYCPPNTSEAKMAEPGSFAGQ